MLIHRGDIYYADLGGSVGSEQDGHRPVLVIQNDKGNRFSPTLIIAPISSKVNKPPIPTHVPLPAGSLQKMSIVLLEQIRTIDKQRLGQWVGKVDETTLDRINEALKISLGL